MEYGNVGMWGCGNVGVLDFRLIGGIIITLLVVIEEIFIISGD